MLTGIADYLARKTLQRAWWRSDKLWANNIVVSTPLRIGPYLLDRFALKRSKYWSREKISALVESRLSELFAHADTIPHWKNIFAQHPKTVTTYQEYLRDLPIMSRADFKQLSEEEYCAKGLMRGSVRGFTSGSTGTPFTFLLDTGTLVALWAVRDRQFCVAARGKRYPIIIFMGDTRLPHRFFKPHFIYLRSFNDIPERFAELRSCMETFASDGGVLYTYPSSATALAKHMQQQNLQLPIRALVLTGESLTDEDRSFLEQMLTPNIALAYGSRESSCIAFECEHHRTHINEEDTLVEVVDESGHVLPAGKEGRILITHLGYKVMPFIRYQNGDLGTLSNEQCPCGITLQTLTVKGRVPIVISQKDDYAVTLVELTTIFNHFLNAVFTFQVVQKSDEEFVIRVVPGPTYEQSQEALRESLLRKLHPDTRLTLEVVDVIEAGLNGKPRYYVKEY